MVDRVLLDCEVQKMNKFQEDKMEYRQYRRTIEELERARQEAEKARLTEKEANAVKAEFLANMSHEVRTPINAMLGFNEMIMKETQESQTAEYAVNVKAAGTALISIINDIFDFTNMEASRLELSHSTYSTRELLQDMVTYADYNVGKKNLKLFTYIDENLPRELSGDAMRITQVLNNLISNAVKYTKKGFVAVTIKWEQITPDRGEMFVSVEDSGIGIRPEDMDKITEYFIRTDMKRNQHIQGLGLGLSIVTKILNLMNSTLQIKSEYEKGSEFSFRLMQDVVDPAPVGKVEWRHDFQFLLQESRGRKFVAPDAKILSVDDNAVNLDLFCGILKDTKVKIDTAMNGEEALELIRKNKYHIIFLDHMMPVMDGMKTLEIIKEERLCPETAVIALTANAVGGMEKRYLGAGFHAYMTKPIEGKRLKDMVRRFLPQVLVVDAKDDEPVSKMAEQKVLEWNKIAEKFPYLDVNIAKGFCSDDINFYLEVLESYVIHQQVEVLEKSYANKDLDAYLVQIHALKSTSKSIGAMHMSEHARALEIAAKEKDMDYIRKNHVCVIAEYKELLERVSATLDQQDERQGEKVTISSELRDVPLILVVDDNGLNLRVAEKMLEKQFKVASVSSGMEALEFVKNTIPDLILLDIHMPEMDGFEVLERLQGDLEYKDIPVVFLTANEEREVEVKGFELGAQDFIKKPFSADIMIRRVDRILELQRLQKNLQREVAKQTRRAEERRKKVERLSMQIMQTLAGAIDAKDTYTNGHSVRVAAYSREIARRYGKSQREQEDIYYIGLLHDIGKIGIPDEIITKNTTLSDREYLMVKTHPQIGGDILKNISEIPYIDVGARWHHERYDGTGYPDGLKGEEIPEVARIIGIADAYDAMSSKRNYRAEIPQDVIRKEIIAGRGTQFDPIFADIMVEMIDDDVNYEMREI